MMFNDSSDRACSFSIGEYLRDAGSIRLDPHSDLSGALSHLVVTDRDCLPRAHPGRELELVTHALGRIVHQQVTLVIVAHFEHFRRRFLAFHIPLAQFQIDRDFHPTRLLSTKCARRTESYKRMVVAPRISIVASARLISSLPLTRSHSFLTHQFVGSVCLLDSRRHHYRNSCALKNTRFRNNPCATTSLPAIPRVTLVLSRSHPGEYEMAYDLIIKHGTVIDGTGAFRRLADVAVKDGKVAEIGKVTDGATETIDASDLIVAPGFVDPHTHYDAQICWDPLVSCTSWHGVTTVMMGNCGVGIAPCKPAAREVAAWDLVNVEAIPFEALSKGLTWGGETFPEFIAP